MIIRSSDGSKTFGSTFCSQFELDISHEVVLITTSSCLSINESTAQGTSNS